MRRVAPASTADPPDVHQFAAFISYNRGVDTRVATLLQQGLQRFAKPWYRLRALRVFRDDSSLAANPGLWSSIEQSILSSAFFVLLASRRAAESQWVGREVACWLEHRDAAHVQIVLTDGEIVWDGVAGDFDWERTSALPPGLRGALSEEPRYVDLRWAHSDELSSRDPRFRDAVADLAAPIHGRPKDELIGEDVRQHRRAMLLARSGAATLAALTIAAVALAVVAVRNGNRANSQRRLATSRALAVESEASLGEGRLDLALLLAAQADRTRRTPEARSVLAGALAASAHLRALLSEQPLRLATVSADGRRLAVLRRDGRVAVWDLAARRTLGSVPLPGARPGGSEPLLSQPVALSLSPDGRELAVSVNIVARFGEKDPAAIAQGSVRFWDVDRRRWDPFVGRPSAGIDVQNVTLARRGRVAAWSSGRPGVASVTVREGDRVTQLGVDVPPCGLVLNADGTRLAAVGSRRTTVGTKNLATRYVSIWQLGGPGQPRAEPAASFRLGADAGFQPSAADCEPLGSAAFSIARPNLLAVGGADGIVTLWDGVRRRGPALRADIGDVSELAFSPDGRRLIARGDSGLAIWDLRSNSLLASPLAKSATALGTWFLEDSRTVAAVGSAGTIALSDVLSTSLPLASAIHVGRAIVDAAFAPGGTIAAAADETGTIRFWDTGTLRPDGAPISTRLSDVRFRFAPDGARLLAWGSLNARKSVQVWDVARRRMLTSEAIPTEIQTPAWVGFSERGGVIVLTAGISETAVWDLAGGDHVTLARTQDATDLDVHMDRHTALVSSVWSVGVWDTSSGERVSPIFPRGAAAWSADGTTVATSEGYGTIALWDASTGRRLASLAGGEDPQALSFSRDGGQLAVLLAGGGLQIWDLGRNALLGSGSLADSAYSSSVLGKTVLEFASTGRALMTARGTNLLLWNLDADAWHRDACRLAGRRLSRGEWRQLIGATSYDPAC